MYREFLQKIIGFDKWHLNSLRERHYAFPMIDRINRMVNDGEVSSGMVLEIGCGLGDIISSIRRHNKIGYDIDKKAILAARILHPGTKFRVGSFDSLRDEKISVLIAVNFLHRITYEDCCRYFREMFSRNEVELVVVDEVQSPPYQYAHDYEELFEKLGYALEYRSCGYTTWERSRRKILYFRIKDEE